MTRLMQRFGGCERGAAAVEFGMIAPILILFHFGSVEFVQAWEAHRRVAHVAAALADLTAQKRAVTQAELDDILKAGELMIAPFPSDQLSVRVSSFVADGSGTVKRVWTVSRNWKTAGEATLPKDYLAGGESLIVANVAFKHKALFGMVMSPTVMMEKNAYRRPRLASEVAKL